jgi:hypothetical protein
MLRAKGRGKLEIHLDKIETPAATLEFNSLTTMADHEVALDNSLFRGVKRVYFYFPEATNVQFDAWQFLDSDAAGIKDLPPLLSPEGEEEPPLGEVWRGLSGEVFDLQGRKLPNSRTGKSVKIIKGKKMLSPKSPL